MLLLVLVEQKVHYIVMLFIHLLNLFCSSDNMEEMQCQLHISQDTLLMGGHQDKIIEFNLSQGQETKLVCAFFTLV